MKKSILILSSVIFLMSCGGNGDDTTDTTATDTASAMAPEAPAETANADVQKGLDLVAKSDCFTCHKLNETAIGPSYAAVASKYSTIDKQVATDSIVGQILHGGSGKWGTVPMPAHPAVTHDEATAMAAYVLSIKSE